MKKILLIDADGVIQNRNNDFPGLLQAEFTWGLNEIDDFLTDLFCRSEEYSRSLEGAGDFLVALQEKLGQWRLNIDAVRFMNFWFENNIVLDVDFFQSICDMRSEAIEVHLASNQEVYRACHIVNKFDLQNRLDGCFFSHALGHQKPSTDYFKKILLALRCEASDLVFVDDNLCNVEAAQSLGIHSIHHTDAQDTLAALSLIVKP